MMFEHDFPERTEINWSATTARGTIPEAANALILNNKERKEKKLWTDGARLINPAHPPGER